jgi:hypothetical protein
MRGKTVLLWGLATVFAVGCTDRHTHPRELNLNIPLIQNLPTSPPLEVSTIAPGGDQNPRGVAFVPALSVADYGLLYPGDLLVSDNSDLHNRAGMGATIMRITPDGSSSVFFQSLTPVGPTTALFVLTGGFVLVGSVPTTDGTCATMQQGELLVLDLYGHQIGTISDSTLLDSPWDLTADDEGDQVTAYVSNVLSGTITRLNLMVGGPSGVSAVSLMRIASGYSASCTAAGQPLGPAGLALDLDGTNLLVASTADNAIYAVSSPSIRTADAGRGSLTYQDATHLHGPLGLLLTPNGDFVTSNTDAINADATKPSEIVEFSPAGQIVKQFSIDSSQGAATGMDLVLILDQLILAAADDTANSVKVWQFTVPYY